MTDFLVAPPRSLRQCLSRPLAAACLLGLIGPCLAQQPSGSTPALTVTVAAADVAWQQLTPRQKQALAPLATAWPQLTPQQRSKWIALSATFETLTPPEQATVHERMREWAGLSTQERARARLNYSHLKSLSREERKAQWEAYQALSEEEKQRLQRQKPAPKSAAPVSRPTPARADRLVQPPAVQATKGSASAAGTAALDRKTLLPRSAEASAIAPASAAGPAASTTLPDPPIAAAPPNASE